MHVFAWQNKGSLKVNMIAVTHTCGPHVFLYLGRSYSLGWSALESPCSGFLPTGLWTHRDTWSVEWGVRKSVGWNLTAGFTHKPLGCRTAVVQICMASVYWLTCIITSSQISISLWYMSLNIRLCSLNHWQWDIYMQRWRLDPWSVGCLRGMILWRSKKNQNKNQRYSGH